MNFEEMFKSERKFLEEEEYSKNEHGVFIYQTPDGNSILSLDGLLLSYKMWLIDNNILKEK